MSKRFFMWAQITRQVFYKEGCEAWHRKSTASPEIQRQVHNETISIIFKRSEAVIPIEPVSVSKSARNVRPREGNLHSADKKGRAAWIFTFLWQWLQLYGSTILGNQVTTSHGICQVKLPLFSVNDAVLSGVRLNQIKRRISKTVHWKVK